MSAKSLFNCPPTCPSPYSSSLALYSPHLSPPHTLRRDTPPRRDKRYIMNHSVCDLSYSMPRSLFSKRSPRHYAKRREVCLYTCSDHWLTHPLIYPHVQQPHLSPHPCPLHAPYTREFASPTHPEITSPISLIERFIVRCEKNDIYRADDSKRA